MSTTNVKASAATPVTPPTNTQYINLSDYMYHAFNTQYTPTLASEIGFTPLLQSSLLHPTPSPLVSINDLTGLYAEAFISTNTTGPKQVIIAYEGTQLGEATEQDSGLFTAVELKDDIELFKGEKAASLDGSAAFAEKVITDARKQGISTQNIYVTGHSLGAAEADYAASQTGLAGVTFAAPGINTEYTGVYPRVPKAGNVTNYVDAGDPIGNFANDGADTLAPIVDSQSANIKHYGGVDVLPNAAGQSNLQDAVGLYSAAQSENSTVGEAGALTEAIVVNGHDHLLPQYAADLGSNGTALTLYPEVGSTNAPPSFSPSNIASLVNGIVDTSYVAAAMTGGGVPQSSSASSSTSNASVLAASSATSAQAMGVKPHAG